MEGSPGYGPPARNGSHPDDDSRLRAVPRRLVRHRQARSRSWRGGRELPPSARSCNSRPHRSRLRQPRIIADRSRLSSRYIAQQRLVAWSCSSRKRPLGLGRGLRHTRAPQAASVLESRPSSAPLVDARQVDQTKRSSTSPTEAAALAAEAAQTETPPDLAAHDEAERLDAGSRNLRPRAARGLDEAPKIEML